MMQRRCSSYIRCRVERAARPLHLALLLPLLLALLRPLHLTLLLPLFMASAHALHAQTSVASPPASSGSRVYHAGIDVLNYELLIDLPDTGAVIEGRALLTVRRTAPVDTLRLDLLHLRVDSVMVAGRSVRFRRDSARIHIPLPAGADDDLHVAVRYGGRVRDGLIVRTDPAGRWTAFGDNWPNRGRNWIPSVDHPSDKATVTWIVVAPMDRRVVANGVLVEERTIGAVAPGAKPRRLTHWRLDQPIPVYLMVLAAAPLSYHDLGATACGLADHDGCVPQAVYAAPESMDFLPGPFAHAGAITAFFADLIAPYPYPRLAHLQSSTRFGGMENATAIFYSDRAFRERSLRPGLVAHEIAHQWFGNAVTPRDWPHLWLSEGFASYLEALWVAHSSGDSAFRQMMADTRRRVIASPATVQRPIIDTLETDYLRLLNTNAYQKGAWVLHMLRAQLGDSSFFQGVRSYYSRHRHGTADSDDLRVAMEEVAGDSLGWFFDQWLRRPGYAELTFSWTWDPRARLLVLELAQGARFAPYRFPLTLEIRDSRGEMHRRRVEVAVHRTQQIPISLPRDFTPQRIILDPDVELLASFAER